MRKKIVCHLSAVHQAHDTRILNRECGSLTKLGKIILIARHPKRETIRGVDIHPFPEFPNRLLRVLLAPWVMFFMAMRIRADIYHVHDPELILMLRILGLFTGAKTVYDVHEHVSANVRSRPYGNQLLRDTLARIYDTLSGFFVRQFDGVVAATDEIARELHEYRSEVTVVHNYPEIPDGLESPGFEDREKAVCYIGSLTRNRGVKELIEATAIAEVPLLLGGTFSEPSFQQECQRLPGWKNVQALGYVSRDEFWSVLSRCRAGVVTFYPTGNYIRSMPNKLFEYMAAGLPVIASDFPYWKQFTTDAGTGIQVPPKNPEAIAAVIARVVDDANVWRKMSENGSRLAREKFNWQTEEQTLLKLYTRLLMRRQQKGALHE